MDILKLSSGKLVSVDSSEFTGDDALEIARRLFDRWGFQHERVMRTLTYEVETKGWNDCPHIPASDPNAMAEVLRLLNQ